MTAIRMKNNNDSVVVRNARLAVKTELEKKRMCNQAIAKFDLKTKKVYLEYPDGTTTVVGEAMKKGRYSEWSK